MKPSEASGYLWRSAQRSHVGKVRQVNEDSVLARPDLGIWAVADGLGGHQCGDKASHMVVDALAQITPTLELDGVLAIARDKLTEVNDSLTQDSADQPGSTPGSTVASLIVQGTSCAVLWAGDSRAYLLRDGKLRRLSRDHSQAEELVQSGLLDRRDVVGHPASSVLTRAVGARGGLELEDVRLDIFPGDYFLLCSDGLYNEVSEPELERVLSENDCESAAEALLQLALSGEARDNISIVAIQVELEQDTADCCETAVNPVFFSRPDTGES
ncbi:PP2C family protein-serine/threonine phosphatase [Thiorhodococcus minor]|uniref:Serine/threonine-protein phosphatase n=1 Tax=Thiorhodococcus minor TaxID=57489 RepID=A0A6M0K1X0_9GAMM|nr:PP2C family serine/threonine-protein phosphatase [Thiorhodococcus minor]NEV63334.1 serine/threonine-protein phosphatase [Thiorhodococcus minor]